MVTLIIWAAIILGIGGFLLWLFLAGKSAGTDAIARDVADKTADTLAKQDKAATQAASEDVVDRLRKGGF
jgi:hypothetical protein